MKKLNSTKESYRPSKDEYYLEIAKVVAKRSPCLRRHYGAIIIKDDAIVSTGYNGPARGSVNCFEIGCVKDLLNLPHYAGYDYCPAVHAEENCVSGDTLIVTADGTIEKAKNVNSTLISINFNDFEELKVKSTKIDSLKNEVIKIITSNGVSLEVSPDHIMFVMDKNSYIREKLAKDVTLEDYIPMPAVMNIDGKPQILPRIEYNSYKLVDGTWPIFSKVMKSRGYTWRTLCKKCGFSFRVLLNLKNYRTIRKRNMIKLQRVLPEIRKLFEGYEAKKVRLPEKTTPDFCQIVGYFIRDGSLSHNYVAFHDNKKELLQYYDSLIEKVFGVKGVIRKSSEDAHYELIVSSHRLTLLFKRLNFGAGKNKQIPKIFHRIENESLKRLIRGLFDACGTVDEKALHFTSSSKDLVDVLRLLLLRLGIFASIYTVKRNGGSKGTLYYSLEINGEYIEKFNEEIGFSDEERRRKLDEIIKYGELTRSALRVYPVEWFKKFEIPTSLSSALIDKNKKQVTYSQAKLFIEEIKKRYGNLKEVKLLEKVIEKFVFLKVKKIERYQKRTEMFDFYAPPFHNFIANGIMVHNCITNAARNGTSVFGGIMYLYGIDAKTNTPIEGMPCPRCKRLIINAGIKEVVTLDKEGNIKHYNVKDWIKEDQQNYIQWYNKFSKKERE